MGHDNQVVCQVCTGQLTGSVIGSIVQSHLEIRGNFGMKASHPSIYLKNAPNNNNNNSSSKKKKVGCLRNVCESCELNSIQILKISDFLIFLFAFSDDQLRIMPNLQFCIFFYSCD